MKIYAMILTLTLSLVPVQAAVIGTLSNGIDYQIALDDASQVEQTSSDGTLSIDLPQGMHLIAIVPASSTRETNPTPSATPDPNSDPTGQELFVAGFDEISQTNRFEVLDHNGLSLTGSIEILEGVNTPADILATDLNHDDTLEVIAAGYNDSEGVILEFWSGRGQKLQRIAGAFDSTFSTENYLVSGNLDGAEGCEAILVGRDAMGAYQLKAYDFTGQVVADFETFAAGTARIDDLFSADVDGDGSQEIMLLGCSQTGTVELKIADAEQVLTTTLVYGAGYSGDTQGFSVDLDGDGASEIATVRKNTRSDSFRLLVLDNEGTILMKKNLLAGKFEDTASFTAADVDSDGRDEIIASSRLSTTGENVIQIIDDNGDQLVARTVLDSSFDGANVSLFADVDGDGQSELVVGGLNRTTGKSGYQVLTDLTDAPEISTAGASMCDPDFAASDLDADGADDLVILVENIEGSFGLELRDGQNGEIRFEATVSAVPSSISTGNLL